MTAMNAIAGPNSHAETYLSATRRFLLIAEILHFSTRDQWETARYLLGPGYRSGQVIYPGLAMREVNA